MRADWSFKTWLISRRQERAPHSGRPVVAERVVVAAAAVLAVAARAAAVVARVVAAGAEVRAVALAAAVVVAKEVPQVAADAMADAVAVVANNSLAVKVDRISWKTWSRSTAWRRS